MPSLPFQPRLKPAILNGSKPGTVRQVRLKNPIKPGDTLYHFTGMRTKKCKKFNTNKCVAVFDIKIDGIKKTIAIEGVNLVPIIRHWFAVTDIAGTEAEFFAFFEKQNYARPLVWIVWDEKAANDMIDWIHHCRTRIPNT
jgi:hypothetical protein